MEMLQGVWKQDLRPRAVVGYDAKIFLPSPPNYVTRSPGCNLQEKLETMLMQNLGGQTKSIMVFSGVNYLNYSKHWHITNSHRSATPPVQELKC